ncbi:hypothetical protein BDV96DRAFT_594541 [Lophiotrema nucula]|uniref:Uncharacterized protein n=1 Tax=Lophiotrema nucula TaxID=690887 RepID=A0A6A5ZSV3_9PLEO|nr:hypothetical protein BDV96DRAFT_594541 [Lophiotrema nucula]
MAERICEWVSISDRRELDGYHATHWSRVWEESDWLWVWTAWKTDAAYEAQKASPQTTALRGQLAGSSPTPPTTRLIRFDGAWHYTTHLHELWQSVMLCYLAPSDANRDKIGKVRGMVPISGSYIVPPKGAPTARGFVHGDSKAPAQDDVYMFLDWWQSPIREEEIRGPNEACAYTETESRMLNENVKAKDVNFDWEKGRKDREEEKKFLNTIVLIK